MHKTGGTTMSHILRSSFGLQHCQVEPWHARWSGAPFSTHDFQHLRKLYPNLKSIAGHRLTAYVDLQENGTEFKYFTLVRDPLKLCASRFQFKVNVSKKKNLDFQEWIQRDWPRNHQTKMIAGVEDVDEAIRIIKKKNIFVGLTERFDESMILLKALMANDLNISYKRVNVAGNNSIKKHLLSTESTRQMLIEAQKVDLEFYNFVRQELYPSYLAEYGASLETDLANYRQSRSNSFNYWNLTLSRLKQYLIYKPLLYFYRRGVTVFSSVTEKSVQNGIE